jgi:hypothetical protein
MHIATLPRRAVALAGARTTRVGGSLALISLTPAEARCQSGTCCPEPRSTCVIGEWVRPGKFAKLSGGSCASQVDA